MLCRHRATFIMAPTITFITASVTCSSNDWLIVRVNIPNYNWGWVKVQKQLLILGLYIFNAADEVKNVIKLGMS